MGHTDGDDWRRFEEFVEAVEGSLRRALVAAYGFERGREAAADALSWAWEHQDRMKKIENKVAYLFRVGQTSLRHRRPGLPFVRGEHPEAWVEPALPGALAALPEKQRVVVVLVHGYQWRFREVAELLGIRVTTVQSHLERGLQNLRKAMEVRDHA